MSPINTILVAGLLALGSVDAAKDKVRVSQWLATDCSGFPSHSDFELTKGHCKGVEAQSLKFHHPKKAQDLAWADHDNQKKQTCYVSLFRDSTCEHGIGFPKDNESRPLVGVELPKSFELCQSPSTQDVVDGIRSVRFHCEDKQVAKPSPLVSKYSTTYTVYDHSNGQTASPHVFTSSTTFSYNPAKRTSTPVLNERVEPTASAVPEPRAASTKWWYKPQWYLHPWARSELCFGCWLREKNNFDKFECEATPDSNNAQSGPCGAPPHDQYVKAIEIDTATITLTRTNSVAAVASRAPTGGADHELEERKTDKKIVRIIHPFGGQSTCAKAYWKHAGDGDKQKIVLKGPHKCAGDSESWSIEAKVTTTELATSVDSTTTVTTTVASTVATYVPPNPVFEGVVGNDRALWEGRERGL